MFPNTYTITPAGSFTRPADTTAYASGDLVANSTTAGSVVPISIGNVLRGPGLPAIIKRVRLRKSGGTQANASFRVHLYNAAPTQVNGDNVTIAPLTGASAYLGSVDVTTMLAHNTSGTTGFAAADIVTLDSTIYAILEARAAYVPDSAEVFYLSLEVAQG